MADILIKNIELKGSLLLTPKAIFKPVEEYDNEKIVQKWEIVKEAEIKTLPEHGDLIDRDALLKQFEHLTAHPTGYEVVTRIMNAPVILERTT